MDVASQCVNGQEEGSRCASPTTPDRRQVQGGTDADQGRRVLGKAPVLCLEVRKRGTEAGRHRFSRRMRRLGGGFGGHSRRRQGRSEEQSPSECSGKPEALTERVLAGPIRKISNGEVTSLNFTKSRNCQRGSRFSGSNSLFCDFRNRLPLK